MNTTKQYFRIDRRKIHLLRFLLEGYDGIATLTTKDPQQGLVFLNIPPGCVDDVAAVMRDFEKHVVIVRDHAILSTD